MSMKYRRLDGNWDYCFGRNKSDFLTDLEAVAQAIKSRLQLLYAEWWEDTEDGLPLWEQIIAIPGSPNNKDAVDIIIRSRIAETTDVLSVLAFSSTYENRKYAFECLVATKYGELTVTN